MLKDITLGQYFPGNSPLHRLDPRIKIICTILYIVVIFLAKNVWAFAFLILLTAGLVLISKISPITVIKGLKPLIFIIAFTAILNLFFSSGEKILFEWKFIHIYEEGVMFAVLMIVRVITMLAGTSVILTYTTSPIALTDGLERLLMPLAKIGLPVHDFAMMLTIALRFIPPLVEETDKIMKAQQARGVDFATGNIMRRLKALLPILIPLVISAFRRAKDLAVAMECRCYRGGKGRTRMTSLHLMPRDFMAVFLLMLAGAGTILLNIWAPGFTI